MTGMAESPEITSYQRAEHWLLTLVNELMMRNKPEPFEPDKYSTEIDAVKAQSYDRGWWDAVEQLSIIGDAIRTGEYG